ncbi:hypoxanthine phosphoribosyltransferase [Chloroflexota bacterium]
MNDKAVPEVLVKRSEIEDAVSRLARRINEDYKDKSPVLVAVLKGAFVFMADLMRQLDMPLETEFVGLSSYGENTQSLGKISITLDLNCDISGRDVIIIEDIIDSGLTTAFLLDSLEERQPASLKICALADKPSRRKAPVVIDYLGFSVPDRFLVGYGMDCAEKYRNLPDICFIED